MKNRYFSICYLKKRTFLSNIYEISQNIIEKENWMVTDYNTKQNIKNSYT